MFSAISKKDSLQRDKILKKKQKKHSISEVHFPVENSYKIFLETSWFTILYYYHKIYISEIWFNYILSLPGLNKLNRLASGAQNLWDAPDFSNAHILPRKIEKPFDLQVFSQIGEAMTKLQWILNTIMNNSVFVIFWYGKYLINCLGWNGSEV